MSLIDGLDELAKQRTILQKDMQTVAKAISDAPEDADMPEEHEAFTRLSQGVQALNAVEAALAR